MDDVELEGKEFLIVYDDMGVVPTRKQGIITNITEFYFELDHKYLIPRQRIIRMERKNARTTG